MKVESLSKILPFVESPARYMGGEANSVVKDKNILASMALIFPDLYEIGMSNNGMRILYNAINSETDLLCEVAFAPWGDMAELMRKNNIPLYTHASFSEVKSFDAVGITVQTELNFTNIPYILELAGISVFAEERGEEEPVIIAGGPAMANPMPIADFFDCLCIGDGELATQKVLRLIGEGKRTNRNRAEILEEIAKQEGFYVPAIHKNIKSVKRIYIKKLSKELLPTKNLIANIPLVHDRFCVEVMRGCTQGCRFCQAGYWYRPTRELNADDVLDIAKEGLKATGDRQLGLLSLSTADYSPVEPMLDSLIEDSFFDNIDVSLPSLRVSSFGGSLASKVYALKGGRSATFAPETGSERLRKFINKTITDADIEQAAESAFQNGFNKIKLYIMVGFPTETEEDILALVKLTERLLEIGLKYNKKCLINLSVGIFVPKAWTPLQWSPFIQKEKAIAHIKILRDRFFKHKNVKISWNSWETAHLEALYSRGGKELSKLIYEAYKRGLVFESDSAHLKPDEWEKIRNDFGYDDSWVFKEFNLEENLPWDIIDAVVSKKFLQREWENAHNPNSQWVQNCKQGKCQACGIPGNGSDTVLGKAPEKYAAPSRTVQEIKNLQKRISKANQGFAYRIVFRKMANSRFLPHQNTLSFFERAFVRLGIPLKFSEGFSPKPKIANTGALPLGLESLCEVISIEFLEKLDLNKADFIKSINACFPLGLEIVSIEPLQSKLSANFPVSMDYCLLGEYPSGLSQKKERNELPVVLNHRGQSINLNEHILSISEAKNALSITVKCNAQGSTVSPFTIYSGLLGISEQEARALDIVKLGIGH
ncbi:MAG: TIGR03960 family B12-binding radical SAM protein [Fibromonadaceae bacterium]|nr:TIGR03960 family B12-binding radical SAM protein [Fibromonadaceae bacterium]